MPRIPVDSNIPVYLALSRGAALQRPIHGRALVIVPDASDWNDFGSRLRADLHLIGVEEADGPLRMRLMFQGRHGTRSYFIDELNLSEAEIRPRRNITRITQPFVSVLQSENDYRALVDLLGFDDSIGCLRRMHDAVLARLENETDGAPTLALTNTIDFHQSALRDEATWVAFRQADRYLTPNRPPDVEEAANSFTVEADLRGMAGIHILDADFGEAFDADFGEAFPLSRRALVLVGQNGTGKTRLFEAMIDGLRVAPPWDDELDVDRAATFAPQPDFSRLIVFSSVASDPYPQSLPPWEGIDYGTSPMASRPSTRFRVRSAFGFNTPSPWTGARSRRADGSNTSMISPVRAAPVSAMPTSAPCLTNSISKASHAIISRSASGSMRRLEKAGSSASTTALPRVPMATAGTIRSALSWGYNSDTPLLLNCYFE
nr:hypothetical protein [Pseudaminobacter salicylatoxidans]